MKRKKPHSEVRYAVVRINPYRFIEFFYYRTNAAAKAEAFSRPSNKFCVVKVTVTEYRAKKLPAHSRRKIGRKR